MMRQNTIFAVVIFASFFSTLIVGWWCLTPTRRSELQTLLEKYQLIRVDMTEQQVDELLAVYEMRKWKEGVLTHSPDEVVRPSAFTKSYVLQLSPLPHETASTSTEGDYFIDVFYDETGLVVGKRKGAVCK
jgi:hypothetical protein